MQFGKIYDGDRDEGETHTELTGEETVEVFRAVKEALDRLNSMPVVDTRPSPIMPTRHPLDVDEKEVNKDE